MGEEDENEVGWWEGRKRKSTYKLEKLQPVKETGGEKKNLE